MWRNLGLLSQNLFKSQLTSFIKDAWVILSYCNAVKWFKKFCEIGPQTLGEAHDHRSTCCRKTKEKVIISCNCSHNDYLWEALIIIVLAHSPPGNKGTLDFFIQSWNIKLQMRSFLFLSSLVTLIFQFTNLMLGAILY